jgi:hypothetical protein
MEYIGIAIQLITVCLSIATVMMLSIGFVMLGVCLRNFVWSLCFPVSWYIRQLRSKNIGAHRKAVESLMKLGGGHIVSEEVNFEWYINHAIAEKLGYNKAYLIRHVHTMKAKNLYRKYGNFAVHYSPAISGDTVMEARIADGGGGTDDPSPRGEERTCGGRGESISIKKHTSSTMQGLPLLQTICLAWAVRRERADTAQT